MNKRLLTHKIVFGVLLVISIFAFSLGTLFFFSILINDFYDLIKILPMVFIYMLPSVYSLFYFRIIYYHDLSKVKRLIFVSITSIFLILSTVFLCMNAGDFASYLESHFVNYLFPVDMYILLILMFLTNGYLIYSNFSKKNELEFLQTQEKIIVNNNKIKTIVLTTLYFLSLVFLGAFIYSFTLLGNFKINAVGMIYLMIACLLPFTNLVYFILKGKKGTKYGWKDLTLISLNVLIVVLFPIMNTCYPSFIIKIAKPLFPIDPASNYNLEFGILLIICFISLIVQIIYFILAKRREKNAI